MKKLHSLLLACILTFAALAQAPQKMSYQAVIRNTANELVSSQPVSIRISLLQGIPTGIPVYVENHSATTNANGLVSLEIGNGTSVLGSLSTIDWSAGPYFIKTETDPLGGTNYTVTGTSQFLSVPYALFAERCNTPGPQGAAGTSAYDLAVQSGFQGTQAQWIASLRGADGNDGSNGSSAYDLAVQNGFQGTQAQWITSLRGTDGNDGSTGASAYDLAVQNGFQGTQAQWIASLRGTDGNDGSNGASAYDLAVQNGFQGTQAQWIASLRGADGNDGSNGASAYDLAVQNGFQGTQSQWISSLQGANGSDGANGNNGKNSLVRSSNEPAGTNCSEGGIKLEYGIDLDDDGNLANNEVNPSLTRYVCNGATGSQGPQGPQGPAGSYTAGTGISISNGTINSLPVEYAYYSIGNAVQSSVQTLSPIWFAQANGITLSNGTTFTLNADKLYEVTAVFQIYNVGLEQYTYMFYNVTGGNWVNWCPAYFGESGNDRSYRNETIKFMWKSSSPTSFDFRKFSTNTVNGNLIGTIMIKEIR